MFTTKNNNAQRARVYMMHLYFVTVKQSGEAEVGWAHNPEVDGSRPSSAIISYFQCFSLKIAFKIRIKNPLLQYVWTTQHVLPTSDAVMAI